MEEVAGKYLSRPRRVRLVRLGMARKEEVRWEPEDCRTQNMVLEVEDVAIDVLSGSRTLVGIREVQRVELLPGPPRLVPPLLRPPLPMALDHLDMQVGRSEVMAMVMEVMAVTIAYERRKMIFDGSPCFSLAGPAGKMTASYYRSQPCSCSFRTR